MVSLALDPPSHRRRNDQPPRRWGLKLLFFLVLVAGIGGGGFYLGRRTAPEANARAAAAAAAAPATTPSAAASVPVAPAPSAATAAPAVPAPAAAPHAAAQPVAPAVPTGPASGETSVPGLRRAVAILNGAMEESLTAALPAQDRAMGDELTQVVNRLLVWDLRVSRDGRKGDRLEVLYRPAPSAAPGMPPSGEPIVEAVRFVSQKLGKTLAAYRFQADGAKWARYYRADGSEVEERLVDAPIREYEQVTSLLRDGRRHKGIDFKAPVGTQVYAPFDGTVVRRNWNWTMNGNCLEMVDAASGRHAMFLHLDEVSKDMTAGRRIKKGEPIAHSGNSGHSFAPHLHYQLESPSGQVLDPFDVQATTRGALDAGKRGLFEAERARLDGLLAGNAPAPAAAVTANVAH